MNVVSNAGPLIALGKLELTDLPFRLYGTIAIPEAVFTEVVVQGSESGAADAERIQLAILRNQIRVVHLDEPAVRAEVRIAALGKGEQQTLHLALETQADLVLMDDLLARKKAQQLGLAVKGTLGVLTEAFRRHLLNLQEYDFYMEAIIAHSDIWIDESLVRRAMEIVHSTLRRGE